MNFRLLTDEMWEGVKPVLPPPNSRGRKRVDDRKVLDTIIYKFRTSARWNDLPHRPFFADDATAHRRLQQWLRGGVWVQIRQVLEPHITMDWDRIETKSAA